MVAIAIVQIGAQESGTPGAGNEAPVASSSDSQVSTTVDESTLILGSPSDPAGDSVSVSAFSFWDLARMVLVLAIVVGIIYGIFYFLKKAGNGKYTNSEEIRLLGSRTLPGNRSVYLVQVGAQVFMLGGGGDAVNMLSEITDKETVDALILTGGEVADTPKRSFGEMISGLMQNNQAGSLDFMRRQRERLQRMR
jgi:flagellar protein FliO/FliZ